MSKEAAGLALKKLLALKEQVERDGAALYEKWEKDITRQSFRKTPGIWRTIWRLGETTCGSCSGT
ncbi:MAG: hypothetical protein PHP02_05810 [Eubacteriales bacterium]|nr:hypothetical protein [Eubacteriales bacterium]